MPDPDGVIENASLADKTVTSRLLDDNLTAETFTANSTFTGPYETNVAGPDTRRIALKSGRVFGFTGDGSETSPGQFTAHVNGSGDSRTLQSSIWAPSFLDDEGAIILVVRSASFDDSTSPPGWVFASQGSSSQTAEVILQAVDLRVQGSGKATIEGELVIPAVTSDPSSPADGNMWLHTVDNALYIWEGGARRTVASW